MQKAIVRNDLIMIGSLEDSDPKEPAWMSRISAFLPH